jgi:hypothetical protein
LLYQKKLEDTKGLIRSRKSKKVKQYNGQRKRINSDVQNTAQKTKATRAPQKQGFNSDASEG